MKRILSLFLFVLLFLIKVQGQNAGDFRSKTGGTGNWNDYLAWETYNGSSWVAASTGQLPTATSAVLIQTGHTMTINATGLVSGNLTVTGTLAYHATTVSALTVSGNVVVNPTGIFQSPSSGTVITHSLSISGNLRDDGVFNMNYFSTAGVPVTFTGAANDSIYGIGTTANFYSITVNKGTSTASILEVSASRVITIAPPTTTGIKLSISAGTFKLSSASALQPYYGQQVIVSSTQGRLWMNNASASIQNVGAGTSVGTGRPLCYGTLQIDAGTFSYGSGNDIFITQATIIMGGPNATMNIYGSLAFSYGATFIMTAGNINIYPQAANNNVSYNVFYIEAVSYQPAVTANFTGGTLTIVDPPTSTTLLSLSIVLASNSIYNFAGSTIRFGDGVSDKAGNTNGFQFASNAPLGNVIVNNKTTSILTTRIVKLSSSSNIGGLLTINSGTANQFSLNGFTLNTGGNIVNSGTFNGDGFAANSLVFNGTTQQVVSGTGTFTNNNINNITVNNTSVSSPSVDLRVNLSVSNGLTLTNGTLGSTNASVFTIGRSASSTTFSLTRTGGSLSALPTFALSGVTTINYSYNTPTPAASQTTGYELPAATQLTTFTVNNTSGVVLDKAVSCTTLALTAGILTSTTSNSITVTGTATTNITGGSATSYVNGPLTRTLPNNAAAANYKFFIGKTAYRLFEYETITTAGTGTATFTVEAFDAGPYPGTAGNGMATINTDKYWKLTTNLGTVTITSSKIRITEAGLGATNKIGQSNLVGGSFNNVGGVLGTGTISSGRPLDYTGSASGTFFRIGTMGTFASGNYAIGPNGPYSGYAATFTSFQNAINAASDVVASGNVIFEFQSDYLTSVEVYPIILPFTFAGNSAATVTFRPATGVSTLINFSNAGNVISNTGADYVILDGRAGGAGTGMLLQFTNTTTTGAAVSLSGDALYNQFLYCILKGSNTTAASGLLFISAPTTGNNYYTVDHCNFDGSSSASNCIYSTGTATNATITNNNFFDYRNGGGIYLASGSNACVIDNNSFYQTTSYVGIAGTTYGIYLASGDNCQISNNNIGGNATALAGIWTVSATTPVAYNFTGISATCGTTITSKLYNNKIQNFDWKASTGITWTAINVGGSVNVGTNGANLVGSNTGNDNIKVTAYSAGTLTIRGIVAGGSASNVENNNIGSITAASSGVINVGSTIYPVVLTGSQVIKNNVIGSTVTAQSINASTTGSTNSISAIYCTPTTTVVTGNTIANLYSAAPGANSGVYNGNYGGTINISGNTIYNIFTAGAAASIIGIYDGASGTSSTNTISGNTINNLSCTGTGATSIYGIQFAANDGGTNNVIEKNMVHSFVTTSNTAVQYGIYTSYGTFVMKNNVVRLGIDITGASITSTAQITGIYSGIAVGCCVAPKLVTYYFNTVYVGGNSVVAGTVKTYAFLLANHGNYSGAGNGEDIRNNIFMNVRTNAVANPLNYAISLPAIMTGVPCINDYNIYDVSSTDGKLSTVGGTDRLNMAALQLTYPGNDLHSGFGDPLLAHPADAIGTMSLNLTNTSPAEGRGIAIIGLDVDFTGLVRSNYSPTDIGAYAGIFLTQTAGQDIWFPVITCLNVPNTGLTTNRTLTNFATITDIFMGVNVTPGTRPRLYYKKATDANAFVGNTNVDNGWKWVEATGGFSPFTFIIDYSILNGGSAVIGDVIQYFVVAQDNATTPNVTFNPPNGAIGTSVAPTGMTAPTVPNSYGIVPTIISSVNVGTGYTYTTLTGTLASGGLFAAMNAGVINTNVVATIKTDLVEPGTVALNLLTEEGPSAGTLTFTIQSDGIAHLISGSLGSAGTLLPLIPIYGACRVTIDGGAGKFLTFRNTYSSIGYTGPVIMFNNGSQSCTLKRTILESNGYNTAAALVNIGTTGANSVTITGNDLRDARGGITGAYSTGIYSNSVNNTLVITNNNIYNWKSAFYYETHYGIYLPAVANGCVISGNSFYMESGTNPTCGETAIYIAGGNSHSITGNFIGGSGPACTGTWTSTLTSGYPTTGIYVTTGTAPASTIQGNMIQNFNISGTPGFIGIENYNGLSSIIGNTIGSTSVANSIQLAGAGASYGVYNLSPTLACNIDQNVIANVSFTAASGSPSFRGIQSVGGNVRKNKMFVIGTSVAALTPIIYGVYNSGGFASNEFSNNMISLNGGSATNPSIYGFYEASATGTTGFYYNSINLYGSPTGAASSYAFYRAAAAVYIVKDNILVNTRTGGTGKHYAIYSTPVTGFTSNYNDLYVTGAVLGNWGGTDKANLAAWQAIAVTPKLDSNSLSTAPAFTSATDLHITADANIDNHGTPVSVTTDIDNLVRDVPVDMGINIFGCPAVIPSAFGANNLCPGSSGRYSVIAGWLTYGWSVTGGTITSGGTSADSFAVINWVTSGIQNIKIIAARYGCVDTIKMNVTVKPKPISAFSSPDTILAISGNLFTFTNNTTITSGTFTSLWNFGDAATSVLTSPTHSYAALGIYPVKLVNTSDFGCKDSLTKNYYVASKIILYAHDGVTGLPGGQTAYYYGGNWVTTGLTNSGVTNASGYVLGVLPAGLIEFRMHYANTEALAYISSPVLSFQTCLAKVKVVSSTGAKISGAQVSLLGYGGWSLMGTTDTSGTVSAELLPGNYFYNIVIGALSYSTPTAQSACSLYTLTVSKAVVYLKSSTGAKLAGGVISVFLNGNWQLIGTTDTSGSVSIQLMPGLYNFMVKYAGTQATSGNVDASLPVNFTTCNKKIYFLTNLGAGIAGATAYYLGSAGWTSMGVTNVSGLASIELLPGNYFYEVVLGLTSMSTAIAKSSCTPDTFILSLAQFYLKSSTGAGLAGGSFYYWTGSWTFLGTTDATGLATASLSPGSYSLMVQYAGTQIFPGYYNTSSPVTFNTCNMQVTLRNSLSVGIPNANVYYLGYNGWNVMPNTDVNGFSSKEILPGTYYVVIVSSVGNFYAPSVNSCTPFVQVAPKIAAPDEDITINTDFKIYPNPVNNGNVNFDYSVNDESDVSILIFDTKGTQVAEVLNSKESKGEHTINWNTNELKSGVYYCRFMTNTVSKVKSLIIGK